MKKIAFKKYTQGDYLLGRGKDQAILASFLLFCRIRHRSSSSSNNGGGRSSGCISKSTDWKYLMLNVDVKQREHPRAGPKAGPLVVCSWLLPGHRHFAEVCGDNFNRFCLTPHAAAWGKAVVLAWRGEVTEPSTCNPSCTQEQGGYAADGWNSACTELVGKKKWIVLVDARSGWTVRDILLH